MAKNQSYFAEERNRSNPHFYNKMKEIDIRRKVKRIVQDVFRGNIEDQDLVYFTNKQIISACVVESFEQWKYAYTIQKALMYYNAGPLASGQVAFQNDNIYDEKFYNLCGDNIKKDYEFVKYLDVFGILIT